MRCGRCKFENIPGQKTCIKCGAALEIKSTAINIYPPRMPSWKKSLRSALRWVRQAKLIPQQNVNFHFPLWIRDFFSDSFWGLFLLVVPGLAHLVQGRFKEVRWYFFAWLALILSGLFFYGSAPGYVLLGSAIGVHTGITIRYGILKDLPGAGEKIMTVIFVLLGLTVIYRFIPRVVLHNLTSGYASLTIPYYKVEAGDYLLARQGPYQKISLPRGSLVLIHPVTLTSHGTEVAYSRDVGTDVVIGEIVGLAGEQLQIVDGVFIVNGQMLEMEKYPVPQWLRKVDFSVTVPDDSYFVSMQYSVTAHNIKLNASYIGQVCLVKAGDIEAKAFMRWWPLSRRGFIR